MITGAGRQRGTATRTRPRAGLPMRHSVIGRAERTGRRGMPKEGAA
jgi:hypothetical protein